MTIHKGEGEIGKVGRSPGIELCYLVKCVQCVLRHVQYTRPAFPVPAVPCAPYLTPHTPAARTCISPRTKLLCSSSATCRLSASATRPTTGWCGWPWPWRP